ncbi:MAG TPA: hypothetical protein VGB95_05065, partial [Chitinophagales bacterium]
YTPAPQTTNYHFQACDGGNPLSVSKQVVVTAPAGATTLTTSIRYRSTAIGITTSAKDGSLAIFHCP